MGITSERIRNKSPQYVCMKQFCEMDAAIAHRYSKTKSNELFQRLLAAISEDCTELRRRGRNMDASETNEQSVKWVASGAEQIPFLHFGKL